MNAITKEANVNLVEELEDKVRVAALFAVDDAVI